MVTDATAAPPSARLVMVGASNVALGLPVILENALELYPGRIRIDAAMGHGRALSRRNGYLCWSYPTLLECGLWTVAAARPLAEGPPESRAAILCDVGNDLMYGVDTDRVVGLVQSCLSRLAGVADRLVVVTMPMKSINRLSPRRFLWLRRLMFPQVTLDLPTLLGRAQVVNQQLMRIAEQHGATLVRPPACWFGCDPIHIRPRFRRVAWRRILRRALPATNPTGFASASLPSGERAALRKAAHRARPAQYRYFGRKKVRNQPVVSGERIQLHWF